jgi:hypothetical protein
MFVNSEAEVDSGTKVLNSANKGQVFTAYFLPCKAEVGVRNIHAIHKFRQESCSSALVYFRVIEHTQRCCDCSRIFYAYLRLEKLVKI